jgi:hypothetical protein
VPLVSCVLEEGGGGEGKGLPSFCSDPQHNDKVGMEYQKGI